MCERQIEAQGGRHLTYLTASTSVRLGGGAWVWVEFMKPCTHMSSVYNCRYGLKLKKRQLGLGWWSCMRQTSRHTHGRGELKNNLNFKKEYYPQPFNHMSISSYSLLHFAAVSFGLEGQS